MYNVVNAIFSHYYLIVKSNDCLLLLLLCKTISRQQKRNLLTVLSFIGVVTLMIVNAYKMSILHDLEQESFMSQSLVSDEAQRLPDVIIVGVKKSGTITLGKF